jgi:hypothetical protein
VVVYHFFVAAVLTGVLIVVWATPGSSWKTLAPQEMSVIIAPFALIYFIVGWGMLRWKNWSRTVSLVLNWVNLFAVAVSVARVQMEGVISAVLSCLVLWWLSAPAVKLQFRSGKVAG